ncbi:hypothetical protein H0H92_010146 [Tricholoma furcatifolium]|nr:hypothetical protein H0H92_010146 [Tricholoma furcatifolium]
MAPFPQSAAATASGPYTHSHWSKVTHLSVPARGHLQYVTQSFKSSRGCPPALPRSIWAGRGADQ